jgi:hypothetical protein
MRELDSGSPGRRSPAAQESKREAFRKPGHYTTDKCGHWAPHNDIPTWSLIRKGKSTLKLTTTQENGNT